MKSEELKMKNGAKRQYDEPIVLAIEATCLLVSRLLVN